MKITIVGAWNIWTQFAVHCAQENDVLIYTSSPNLVSNNIVIKNEKNDVILRAKNIKATYDKKDAFADANIIFITYPAFSIEKIAKEIYPYIHENLKIWIIPWTGWWECAFSKFIEKGVTIFWLQRVPSVARLIKKWKSVRAIWYRNELYVASLPIWDVEYIAKVIEKIFNIKCNILPNYLNLTLTPSNPILHTVRLKTIFKDYYKWKFYDSLPLFYEDWNDESSELLLKCDKEVQNICNALWEFNLSYVKSLKDHYGINNITELTKKIQNIEGFKWLETPYIQTNNWFEPNFNSRYFTADFSFWLSIFIQIWEALNVNIKNLKETMEWYRKLVNHKEFSFKSYNMISIDDIITYYSM